MKRQPTQGSEFRQLYFLLLFLGTSQGNLSFGGARGGCICQKLVDQQPFSGSPGVGDRPLFLWQEGKRQD